MDPGHSPPPVILFWLQLAQQSLAKHTQPARLHTHIHARLFFYTTHSRVFLTEIEVTSQQSHCKSVLVASSENTPLHTYMHTVGQWVVLESEPLRDPSSPGVEFLPLLLVLHELLLHLLHGTLRRRPVLLREDVREGECLALGLGWRGRERK